MSCPKLLRTHARVWLALLMACCSACEQDFRECSYDETRVDELPERLSQTGLYADIAAGTLAEDVLPFSPRFALWSDGAEKERFIRLPDGARIDTRDMDDWQFPVGTQLWKQFTRDGVRVETRLEQKVGPDATDWALVAYVWDAAEAEAFRTIDGEVNAHGTPHDVPRASDCIGCHGGRKSRVLGFSAVQLSHAPDPDDADALTLSDLIARELLSESPRETLEVPGSEAQVAGLGYLHANCGHCHNRARPPADDSRCYDPEQDLDFTLRSDALTRVAGTAAVRTALDPLTRAGSFSGSKVERRMNVRDPDLPSMPPLATERVDREGVATVRAFVDSLRAGK